MQARFNQLQATDLDKRKMVGLEYDLWYHNTPNANATVNGDNGTTTASTAPPPPTASLYVVRKQYRTSPNKGNLIKSRQLHYNTFTSFFI